MVEKVWEYLVYELCEEITTRKIAERIKEKLDVEYVRAIGNDNYAVKLLTRDWVLWD